MKLKQKYSLPVFVAQTRPPYPIFCAHFKKIYYCSICICDISIIVWRLMYVRIKGLSFLCGFLNAAYSNGHSNPNPSSLVLKAQRDRGPSLSFCCAMDIKAVHSHNPWIPLYAQESLNPHIFKRNIIITFENHHYV